MPKKELKKACAHPAVEARRKVLKEGKLVVCPDCQEELGKVGSAPKSAQSEQASKGTAASAGKSTAPTSSPSPASRPASANATEEEVPLPSLSDAGLLDLNLDTLIERYDVLSNNIKSLEAEKSELADTLKEALEAADVQGVEEAKWRAVLVAGFTKSLDKLKLLQHLSADKLEACYTSKPKATYVKITFKKE